MKRLPSRRCLAVLLCLQPVLWTSDVAYAQMLQDRKTVGGSGTSAPPTAPDLGPVAAPMGQSGPVMPADTEVTRGERGLLGVSGVGTSAVPPIDRPIDPDKYVCGPGDVLELNFWGVQNFKVRVTVDVEGRAFVAKVGYFPLQGKTLTEARKVMREQVARFYPKLGFDLTLAEPRTFLVQVVDDVVRPASYPARAVDRVSTLIAKAGGFGPNASRRRIEIRREGGAVLTVDLLLYMLTGDVKYNPYLLDGDVVKVPFEDLAARIDGAVNRPGRYELVKSRDLAELVELAGGLSPKATQLLPVTIVRRGSGDREDLRSHPFTGGKLPAIPIMPEDGVRIPEAEEVQQSVVVVGAIARAAPLDGGAARIPDGESTPAAASSKTNAPEEATATRRLPFVKGDTVRTLLARVGGVGPLADLSGSYILRGGESLPVDLHALVMLRDFRADRAVELGDTLVIPFKRRNILIEGAVFAPGPYPYHPTFSVEQYLALAGGRNRNAQAIDAVKMVTPGGETKGYRSDLKVEPGASLVVPERSFSRPEIVQVILGAAGILVSGMAVAIAARR